MKRSPMKRRTPLRSRRGLVVASAGRQTRKPINSRNSARQRRSFARAYGSKARVEWLKAEPCAISGRTPCDVVHAIGGGMGRKSDARFTLPLHRDLHRELHQIGVASFEAKYSISLVGVAAVTNARWEALCSS